MASGKSTVGPRIARRLQYAYADLDALVEEHAELSIPAIFEEEGEAGFREREARQLHATAEREHAVIALGGGALVSEDNLPWALKHGTVVYLHASPEELVRRLEQDATERPLLQDEEGRRLSSAALRAKVADMLGRRLPYYRRAQITIDTSGLSVEETVKAVVNALQR